MKAETCLGAIATGLAVALVWKYLAVTDIVGIETLLGLAAGLAVLYPLRHKG